MAWIEVAPLGELQKRRRLVVESPAGPVLLLWHEDQVHAMANICVHKDRELAKGQIFDGRVVCPGHQWAFDLEPGFCKERDQSQPVFATRIVDDVIGIDLAD